ncbi:LysR family transcriptional regulator [Mordavella massiliensis]|uniref:LysR family transcriptional regulator n=1 Tax=Mordavella massiliensis TaxID=1871024 RepID=A0A938XCC7_9CLOT|nr:LysR family transcriptional regulator [Mordavella massiliensis]MBM6947612.1 LysR family transcriptional regulator [Mordavella massiliensis]
MNLYHLRYFVTLAHLEHYTKAAELLSITQPSLSHAISSLEKELGVKLFEKEGRNVVLTKCGQVFLEDVQQALSILDSSVSKLQMTGSGEGQIDIAVLRTLSTQFVPGLVRDYLKEHPRQNIEFRFHNSTGLTPDMIEGLKSRKYDIAFCSKMENEPTVEFIPVAKEELVLIVPNGHPLCAREEIDLSETLPYPQIAFSRRSGLRPIIDRLFHGCGGQPEIAYEVEEDQAVAGLVAAGFGIAVVPHMALLQYMPVQIIRIANPTWERKFYMCTLKDVYQAPAINDFKEFVKQHSMV